MRIVFLLMVTTALPTAWAIAEFRGGVKMRRTLGVLAILWSFGIAALIGSLREMNANVYFTTATKELLEVSVEQLRAGRTEVVIREWSRADAEFGPTYENRDRYKAIVDQAVEG